MVYLCGRRVVRAERVPSHLTVLILSPPPPQFVLSGHHFTMNFLLLTIQSSVCVACVVACKRMRVSGSAYRRAVFFLPCTTQHTHHSCAVLLTPTLFAPPLSPGHHLPRL